MNLLCALLLFCTTTCVCVATDWSTGACVQTACTTICS
jgi:hypothetical protein